MAVARPTLSLFHPLIVLTSSLLGAVLYALWATVRFSDEALPNQYLYVVPIVVPFVAFLFDRAERFRQGNAIRAVSDVLIIGTAVARASGHVPLVSGHALFLTYALMSTHSMVARVTAAVVIVQVIYLKFFVWHDVVTLSTGVGLGLLVAFIARRYGTTVVTERPTQADNG